MDRAPDWSQQILHLGATRNRQNIPDHSLGRLAAKYRDESVDEGVELGGSNVDMRGVVLWAYSDARCLWRRGFIARRDRPIRGWQHREQSLSQPNLHRTKSMSVNHV